MEHSLLSPRNIILKGKGIPFEKITPLLKNGRYHDYNLCGSNHSVDALHMINRMEEDLSPLTFEQMDRRVAADFCCIWRYDYPERVAEICKIIGGSDHMALRLHYQISPERRQEFIDYADALKGWLNDISVSDNNYFRKGSQGTVKKVYNFLGKRDPLKDLLVERTYIGLSSRFLNCSFWGSHNTGDPVSLYPNTAQQLPGNCYQRMCELESVIRKEMGSCAGDFLIDVGGSSEPACHFKFMRRVDILVSSIGCMKWRGNLPEKNHNITGRRQITNQYLEILENYWQKNKPVNLESDVSVKIYSLLGKPDKFKKWLTACLWLNLKDQTQTHAYPMKRWSEFVRRGERYLDTLD